jgi:hypothetical protein
VRARGFTARVLGLPRPPCTLPRSAPRVRIRPRHESEGLLPIRLTPLRGGNELPDGRDDEFRARKAKALGQCVEPGEEVAG